MRTLQRAAVSLVAVAVAGLPVALNAPASAALIATGPVAGPVTGPAAGPAAVVPCLADIAAWTPAAQRTVPHWRKRADTAAVTESDLAALPPQQTRPGIVAREVTPSLASRITLSVYAHVIKGRHNGERKGVGPRRVRNLIAILNKAMAGQQSELSAPTRYRFSLKKVDYTRRDGWYHAYLYGPRDQRMKRALHRGNKRTLNLYLNGGGPRNYPVLGWSRFPWQYAGHPSLDGVSVNYAALPGGHAHGYNLGDTFVHETGHWLGLFHTFEGGCGSRGDLVVDTADEDEPSYRCETTRDTCTEPGLDPVHNFMDYSLDSCMNMFTDGQVLRMDAAYENWRL